MLIRSDTFEIRSIDQGKLNDVLKVYHQCEDFLALGPEPAASLTMVTKDIENSQKEGGIFCGVYNQRREMIGVVDFIPSGFGGDHHVAFFSLLMIAPSFRTQGLGTKIVDMIEKEIKKESSVNTICSAVQVNNIRGLRFWQDNGYRVVGGPELQPDRTTVFHLQKDLMT